MDVLRKAVGEVRGRGIFTEDFDRQCNFHKLKYFSVSVDEGEIEIKLSNGSLIPVNTL